MRKISLMLALIFLSLVLLPGVVQAEQYDNLVKLPVDAAQAKLVAEVEAVETDGAVLGIKKELAPIDNGPHFFTGERQVVAEDLVGDVYVFAGEVEVNGKIDGDLIVFGGTVFVNGEVTGDVRAGAGEITINSKIGRNLTVGAGTVVLGEKALVGKSAMVAGGDISLNGQAVGRVLLGGGAARIAGKYDSDITSWSDTFSVAPGVVVGGSLMAQSNVEAMGVDNAMVKGEKSFKLTPKSEKNGMARQEKMRSVGGILVKTKLIELIAGFMMSFISGSVLIYFLPKLFKAVKAKASTNVLSNFGSGLAYLFLAPAVIVLAMISIVALPIAGLMSLVYFGSLVVAKWVAAAALGDKIVSNLKLKLPAAPYLSFGLGLIAFKAVDFLPIFGWMINFVAFAVGMGVIFVTIKETILVKKVVHEKAN